ncbi:MAG: glucose-1-phosphate thymidylyltransferase [Euryarchaeota archaeon]|nr:glucose-1-phosphate thymidylyltransferase [Euryarchaeota archaeon]|tara:strand:+ start:14601 stop:15371 length:771 start_codon:yes stop_codon:yes gene_type:complete
MINNNLNNYKGIILAGGKGTRLYPLTKVVSKQLLPIYDKPMIMYPLETLIRAGIKDILIITNPSDKTIFQDLLGDGSQYDCNIYYEIQNKPEGIAQAFIIAKDWLEDSNCILILGDNIFLKGNISNKLEKAMDNNKGATLFAYEVEDASSYGVINMSDDGAVASIVEKPENPESNYAVTGLYAYDNSVVKKAISLKPSDRGELEITDINNKYMLENSVDVTILPKDSFWLDAGTIDSLLEASNLIKKIKEQGEDLF